MNVTRHAGLVVLTLLMATGSPAQAPDPAAKIDAGLLEASARGGASRFMVVLAEQADLSGVELLATRREKTRFVFERLRATADATQAAVRADLERQGYTVKPFFISNQLLVESPAGSSLAASPAELGRIAASREVLRVVPVRKAFPAGEVAPVSTSSLTVTARPGLEQIGANVLHRMGIDGTGIVVGISDTGVEATHEALADGYRGRTSGHDYNWFDPSGDASPVPVDTNGHGTHVTGIAVGRPVTHAIGVAPGAEWIGCRSLGPGSSAATVLACLEWFLAPTDVAGLNPDPDRSPDVTNHSYICPFCDIEPAFANLQAAGIFVVGATGNFGPACDSTFDPGTYASTSVVSVGATTGGKRSDIAWFSSRGGPSSAGNKPDLVAPGVNILSSLPPNGYGEQSGTSMAAPHLAGAVALAWSHRPILLGDTQRTLKRFRNTAFERPARGCGDEVTSPNTTFGWGVLNVYAAVCKDQPCP